MGHCVSNLSNLHDLCLEDTLSRTECQIEHSRHETRVHCCMQHQHVCDFLKGNSVVCSTGRAVSEFDTCLLCWNCLSEQYI